MRKLAFLMLISAIVLFSAVKPQVAVELHHHINSMLTGEINVAHLANFGIVDGTHYGSHIDFSQLFPQQAFVAPLPHIGWQVQPFARCGGLFFGVNSKVMSLTFKNHVDAAGNGVILSNAIIGLRTGNNIQMISAYGIVTVAAKQQFTQQQHQKCNHFLFIKNCWTETVNIPRGFFHNELDAIVQEGERRAAIAMRQSLGHGSIAPSKIELSSLSSGFVHEHMELRKLYPEIEYNYDDFTNNEVGHLNDALINSMMGLGGKGIRGRMQQFLESTHRSNFLYAPTERILFYIILNNNGNGTFNLHVSIFTVGAPSRLPVGALATSTGAWNLERGGEGATPSVWQILQIFGFK